MIFKKNKLSYDKIRILLNSVKGIIILFSVFLVPYALDFLQMISDVYATLLVQGIEHRVAILAFFRPNFSILAFFRHKLLGKFKFGFFGLFWQKLILNCINILHTLKSNIEIILEQKVL